MLRTQSETVRGEQKLYFWNVNVLKNACPLHIQTKNPLLALPHSPSSSQIQPFVSFDFSTVGRAAGTANTSATKGSQAVGD